MFRHGWCLPSFLPSEVQREIFPKALWAALVQSKSKKAKVGFFPSVSSWISLGCDFFKKIFNTCLLVKHCPHLNYLSPCVAVWL